MDHCLLTAFDAPRVGHGRHNLASGSTDLEPIVEVAQGIVQTEGNVCRDQIR